MRKGWVCAAFLFACGGKPIPSGGKCNNSEQCAAGLLCDTTQKPAICTDKLANPPADMASGDLAGVTISTDMAVSPSTDMSAHAEDMSAVEHDMAATEHDMAKPVDLSHKD